MNPFEADDMALFNKIFATNVQGHINLVHNLLGQLREDMGRVVVIGAPDVPLTNYVIKTSMNAALLGFTRALRVDLMGQGVSVSIIQPAATRGGMVENLKKMI
jgi:NAD(P)-dependent dehydrogenase (short-subunit alcohol dehydrogenase family)